MTLHTVDVEATDTAQANAEQARTHQRNSKTSKTLWPVTHDAAITSYARTVASCASGHPSGPMTAHNYPRRRHRPWMVQLEASAGPTTTM